jgi:hypothetical protein
MVVALTQSPPHLKVIFRNYIYIFFFIYNYAFWRIICIVGEFYKLFEGLLNLKSGLFRGIFFSLGLASVEVTKNPSDGKDPRISKSKRLFTAKANFL